MTFTLKANGMEYTVTCCGTCPVNVKRKASLIFLPSSHHCAHTPDAMFSEGKPILNPLTLPKWCPHVPVN